MFFVVKKSRVLFAVRAIVLLVALGGLLWFFSWLAKPYPSPTIGIQALSTQLMEQLFESTKIEAICLDSKSELFAQLEDARLNYLVELDEPSPGLIHWPIGELAPAIVVPYFDQAVEISLDELHHILQSNPEEILIADTLALPGFPWSSLPVNYLPSTDVIHQLHDNQGKIGIIPLQDRVAQVRVLPLDGIKPRQTSYPLKRSLYLGRLEHSWLEQLKDRYILYRGGMPDQVHLEPLQSSYATLEKQEIRLVTAGDIMLDRDVKKVGLQRGWEYIFAEVAPIISSADIAFANLESPIGDEGHFINMFQAPPEAIAGIVHAGFDVLSLANNHTLDYHHAGMFETMRLLQKNGMDWVGAGHDIQDARLPLIKEIDGVRVGFLGYTEMWFVHSREPISWKATTEEPGVAPADLDFIVEDVTNLRDQVDVVIVTVHWGKEYINEPTAEQKKLARAAIDAGADLVIGHHPHVLQGIGFYKQGVIAYSLGNFVFDLNLPQTWETMILEFSLSRAGVLDMTIIPAYIFGVQPQIVEGSHKNAIYNQIREFSLNDP